MDPTFHPFPRLPAELRLRIWHYTTPGPHVIELVWEGKWVCVTASRTEPNYAMQANKEAHENFSKKWKPFCKYQTISQTLQRGHTRPYLPQPISYFNPDIDTIYIGASHPDYDCIFDDECLIDLQALPCVSQLRFLAIEISEWFIRGQRGQPAQPGRRAPWNSEPKESILGKDWELGFLKLFPQLELFTIADYDIETGYIDMGTARPPGEVQFIDPVKMDENNTDEMWPYMRKRLDELRKLPEGNDLPKVQLKEVMRGSVRMVYE